MADAVILPEDRQLIKKVLIYVNRLCSGAGVPLLKELRKGNRRSPQKNPIAKSLLEISRTPEPEDGYVEIDGNQSCFWNDKTGSYETLPEAPCVEAFLSMFNKNDFPFLESNPEDT